MKNTTYWLNKSVWSVIILIGTISISGCAIGSKPASDSNSSRHSNTDVSQHKEHTQPINKTKDAVKTPKKVTSNDLSTTGKGVTLIGDSVTVGVEPYLKEKLPKISVYGKVGRQMIQAKPVIKELASQGNLGEYVILELGSNGPFNAEQLRTVLQLLVDRTQVVLVTIRVPDIWQHDINKTIKEVASEFSNTKIVDWYTASLGKEKYFYPDGVHLKPSGSKYYASLLVDAMNTNQ